MRLMRFIVFCACVSVAVGFSNVIAGPWWVAALLGVIAGIVSQVIGNRFFPELRDPWPSINPCHECKFMQVSWLDWYLVGRRYARCGNAKHLRLKDGEFANCKIMRDPIVNIMSPSKEMTCGPEGRHFEKK